MQQAITPGIGHISKKNPFMPGDAVVHMSSKQRGIVVQVSRDWAKFELLGEKGRNGQPVYRRFSYHKLTLLATQEQLKQGFEMFQKQRQVMEKKANSPFNRLARRITQFFAPKAQAEPQVAGYMYGWVKPMPGGCKSIRPGIFCWFWNLAYFWMQITFKFKMMRYLIPILLLLSACAEEQTISDPYDASRIVGTWRSMVPANPDWVYQFDGQGFMRQTFHFGGATLSSLEYPYATRQDTVFIGGDANDPARTWVVLFECDSILQVRNITPGTLILGQFWLKRVSQ